ncbi:MAG: hypothetical protein EZS28_001878 [Streblomastix strix]|uniref:Uncharacterized protein n=1 Tax=Streblomastix strix TaxID=222440 RepID=A0A5J4X7U2_9EUKA|nr:MAG: hypothetical protein EZS28_001878 [Streblomastix strix]
MNEDAALVRCLDEILESKFKFEDTISSDEGINNVQSVQSLTNEDESLFLANYPYNSTDTGIFLLKQSKIPLCDSTLDIIEKDKIQQSEQTISSSKHKKLSKMEKDPTKDDEINKKLDESGILVDFDGQKFSF